MDDKDRDIIKAFRAEYDIKGDFSDEEVFSCFSGSFVYQRYKLAALLREVMAEFLKSICVRSQ